MRYYESIQRSIDFIEENIDVDITLKEIAERSCFSLYHFHRIFQAVTGESVKEYIRKRRLSCAAKDLLYDKSKVIDIAFKYQYESAEAFSRAFSKAYGIPPLMFKKSNKKNIKVFERIDIMSLDTLNKKEGLNIRIVKKEQFKVIGYELRTSWIDNKHAGEISEFWSMYLGQKLRDAIPDKIDPVTELGMSMEHDEDGSFSYVIGFEVSSFDNVRRNMVKKTIPEATYAVLTIKGDDSRLIQEKIGEAWDYFFVHWLPGSGYKQAPSANFEVYDERTTRAGFEIDIYIPIN
ncbi:MAG TPA: AraC family transcriptional regulator [Clostridia bacterium]|nr:AraC family transcriptional regulator [Clostridia bacterium]